MDLSKLQAEHVLWHDQNFFYPAQAGAAENSLIGVMEELGELAHANLKRRQGIRGTEADHIEAEKDAIGDVIIYLSGYCSSRGFSLAECVEHAWNEVKNRDWTKNKVDGS